MKINELGTSITVRFFHTLDVMKQRRMIRGLQTFTNAYNLNYWNMSTLRKNPSEHPLRAEWLSYLVMDYGVSATYLLTGVGPMFVDYLNKENGSYSPEQPPTDK